MLRNWQLWQLYNRDYETHKHRHPALTGLFRLFVGEKEHTVNWSSETFRGHMAEVQAPIEDLTSGTAQKLFSKGYKNPGTTFNAVSKRVLRQLLKDRKFCIEQMVFLKNGRSFLSALCLQSVDALQTCHMAPPQREFGAAMKGAHE